jgi:hypothetical protein
VQHLTVCAFSSPYWGLHGGLLDTIIPTLEILFHRTELAHFKSLREHYIQQLLNRIHLAPAIRPLLVVQKPSSNDNQIVCSRITDNLLPLLAQTTVGPFAHSWHELLHYESLFAAVDYYGCVSFQEILKTLLSVSCAFSIDSNSPSAAGDNLPALETFHTGAGLIWLPSVVLV